MPTVHWSNKLESLFTSCFDDWTPAGTTVHDGLALLEQPEHRIQPEHHLATGCRCLPTPGVPIIIDTLSSLVAALSEEHSHHAQQNLAPLHKHAALNLFHLALLRPTHKTIHRLIRSLLDSNQLDGRRTITIATARTLIASCKI